MENNLNPKSENNLSEDIDLKEIFQVLWQRKLEITFITSLFFSLALIYSFFLPNIYESKALLSPVNEQNNVYKTVSNYSSIANLAGLNISPPSTDSNSVKALEKLESLSFFTNNILPNIFLPDLMALRSWDSKTNTITYDDKIYDNFRIIENSNLIETDWKDAPLRALNSLYYSITENADVESSIDDSILVIEQIMNLENSFKENKNNGK